MEEIPEIQPSCISEAFSCEIPDENRLTDDDIRKYIAPNRKKEIDIGNLPFKVEDNHSGLDKRFPMYISKVLEFYEQGGRYKEFRNILKRQKRKEEKQRLKAGTDASHPKNSPMPKIATITNGNFKITFE